MRRGGKLDISRLWLWALAYGSAEAARAVVYCGVSIRNPWPCSVFSNWSMSPAWGAPFQA